MSAEGVSYVTFMQVFDGHEVEVEFEYFNEDLTAEVLCLTCDINCESPYRFDAKNYLTTEDMYVDIEMFARLHSLGPAGLA